METSTSWNRFSIARVFEQSFQMHAPFFVRLVETARTEVDHVGELFERAGPEADAAYLEWLSQDAGDANGFVNEVADLALVAMYHWVERELKSVLSWVPTAPEPEKIAHFAWKQIDAQFERGGVRLKSLRDEGIIQLLRQFANSWKHGPRAPGAELLARLRLKNTDGYGYLGNSRIRSAVRRRLRLPPDAGITEIVEAFSARTQRFLNILVRRVRLAPEARWTPAARAARAAVAQPGGPAKPVGSSPP
jgi:hypothetical protein